jgi:diguanylate cyclase (GGDEF)-like protein/PAS domain S-box-containing protein
MDDTTKSTLNQPAEILLFTQFAMDNAAIDIFWLGSDARFHYVNKNTCETLGYSKEELLQLSIPDLNPLFPIERWNDHWEKLKQDKVQRFETVHARKNGELFPVEVSANYVKFGNLEYNVAYATDITERKRSEAAVLESEEKYRLLTENAHEVVWTMCPRTLRFLYVSPAVFNLRGYTPEEVMAEPMDAALTPEGAGYVRGIITQRIAAIEAGTESLDKFYFNEIEQPCKDGSTVWTEVTTNYFLNKRTGDYEIRGVTRDITERKKSDAESIRNKAIIEAAHDGFWRVDSEGFLREVNQAYATMVGYSVDELLSMHISQLDSEDKPEDVKARIDEIILKSSLAFETKHRHKDGHLIHIDVSTTFLPEAGEFIVFCRDITERKKSEIKLRESEKRLSTILDSNKIHMWAFDGTRYTYTNKEWFDYTGQNPLECLTIERWVSAVHPDDIEESAAIWLANWQTKTEHDNHFRLRRHDGIYRDFICHAVPVFDERGIFQYFQGFNLDITERKQTETNLKSIKNQYDRLVSNIPVGVFVLYTDASDSYTFKYVSPKYCELYGMSAEELLGDPNAQICSIHHEDRAEFMLRNSEAVKARAPFYWEGRTLINGKTGWLRIQSKPEPQPDGGCIWNGIVTDISEQKLADEKIRNLAFYDTLTNLPNRRMLNDRLAHALALSKRTGLYGAVMFIDLDNFKPLNDLYGHGVGDLLLVGVASRLANSMREMDTVARFGGDEFVVMLNELEADKVEATQHAAIVAEKILVILGAPYEISIPDGIGQKLITHCCTASVGVAMFNNHDEVQDEVLKRADMAMYQAKDAGRNVVRFYSPR